jgi:hypothetical protein
VAAIAAARRKIQRESFLLGDFFSDSGFWLFSCTFGRIVSCMSATSASMVRAISFPS